MRRRGPEWDATIPDPSLDLFRGAIAELREQGQLEAYLATRVARVATRTTGHLWWTRWSAPRESVEWLQTHVGGAAAFVEERDGYVPADSPWLAQLREGWTLDYTADGRSVRFEVVWLAGRDRDVAWERFGFDEPAPSADKP